MPLMDLQKLTVGLSRTWAGYLRDWDRSLRSGNYGDHPIQLSARRAQLGRYLGEYSPDPDADAAADDLLGCLPCWRQAPVSRRPRSVKGVDSTGGIRRDAFPVPSAGDSGLGRNWSTGGESVNPAKM
jgi:hypothetical protein